MFGASFPHGWWYYFRACDVGELSEEVIDVMAEYGRRIVYPVTSVALWQMGGAVARVGEDSERLPNAPAGARMYRLVGAEVG